MYPSQWSQETLEKIRRTGMELLERVKIDNAFRERVKQQPIEALTQAGLPREAVGDFLRESQVIEDFDDVSGYSSICLVTVV